MGRNPTQMLEKGLVCLGY